MLAATKWPTNADMILDCVELGYLRDDDIVGDLTYGEGNWWTKWRPKHLVTNDLFKPADTQYDFRNTRFPPKFFDAVAFDPPYVSVGGRKTSTIKDLHERYGLADAPTTPAGVQLQINLGLSEAFRIVYPDGFVLAKCQDYVSGGKLWPGTYYTTEYALKRGFILYDRLEHIGNPRPQPSGRTQRHARRNLSTLLVLKRPK